MPRAPFVFQGQFSDAVIGSFYENTVDIGDGQEPFQVSAQGLPDGLQVEIVDTRHVRFFGVPQQVADFSIQVLVTVRFACRRRHTGHCHH